MVRMASRLSQSANLSWETEYIVKCDQGWRKNKPPYVFMVSTQKQAFLLKMKDTPMGVPMAYAEHWSRLNGGTCQITPVGTKKLKVCYSNSRTDNTPRSPFVMNFSSAEDKAAAAAALQTIGAELLQPPVAGAAAADGSGQTYNLSQELKDDSYVSASQVPAPPPPPQQVYAALRSSQGSAQGQGQGHEQAQPQGYRQGHPQFMQPQVQAMPLSQGPAPRLSQPSLMGPPAVPTPGRTTQGQGPSVKHDPYTPPAFTPTRAGPRPAANVGSAPRPGPGVMQAMTGSAGRPAAPSFGQSTTPNHRPGPGVTLHQLPMTPTQAMGQGPQMQQPQLVQQTQMWQQGQAMVQHQGHVPSTGPYGSSSYPSYDPGAATMPPEPSQEASQYRGEASQSYGAVSVLAPMQLPYQPQAHAFVEAPAAFGPTAPTTQYTAPPPVLQHVPVVPSGAPTPAATATALPAPAQPSSAASLLAGLPAEQATALMQLLAQQLAMQQKQSQQDGTKAPGNDGGDDMAVDDEEDGDEAPAAAPASAKGKGKGKAQAKGQAKAQASARASTRAEGKRKAQSQTMNQSQDTSMGDDEERQDRDDRAASTGSKAAAGPAQPTTPGAPVQRSDGMGTAEADECMGGANGPQQRMMPMHGAGMPTVPKAQAKGQVQWALRQLQGDAFPGTFEEEAGGFSGMLLASAEDSQHERDVVLAFFGAGDPVTAHHVLRRLALYMHRSGVLEEVLGTARHGVGGGSNSGEDQSLQSKKTVAPRSVAEVSSSTSLHVGRSTRSAAGYR